MADCFEIDEISFSGIGPKHLQVSLSTGDAFNQKRTGAQRGACFRDCEEIRAGPIAGLYGPTPPFLGKSLILIELETVDLRRLLS
jgi:hypothetical protein